MENSQEPEEFCYECSSPLDDQYDYSCEECGQLACDNHIGACQECDFTACSSCMILHWEDHQDSLVANSSMDTNSVRTDITENQAVLGMQRILVELLYEVQQITQRLDRLIESVDRMSE